MLISRRGARCGKDLGIEEVSIPLGSKRSVPLDVNSSYQQRERPVQYNEEIYQEMDTSGTPEGEWPIFQEEIENEHNKYKFFQENLYNAVFTRDCLKCFDVEEFNRLLKIDANSQGRSMEHKRMSVFSALKSVSRSTGDTVLSVLSEIGCEFLPEKWETLQRQVSSKVDSLHKYKEYEFPWPSDWKITNNDWKNGTPPTCMKILINDPLQQIAMLLVDPRLMFFFKDQIQLEAKLHPDGVISDFMSTRLAHETQQQLWVNRGFQREQTYAPMERDVLIAIKLYEDGVAIGWGGAASTIAVMGSILNCDIDLQRRDVSKFVIGYINNLTNISEEVLVEHLVKVGMKITAANNEIRYFYRKLENFFKEKFMEIIKSGWEKSYEMHVLGLGVNKVL